MVRDVMRLTIRCPQTGRDNIAHAAPIELLEPRRMLLSAAISFAAPNNRWFAKTTASPVITAAVGDVNGDKIPDLLPLRIDTTIQDFNGTATGALTSGPIIGSGAQVMRWVIPTKMENSVSPTENRNSPRERRWHIRCGIARLCRSTGGGWYFNDHFNGDGNEDLAVATFNLAAHKGRRRRLASPCF